jgi:hypothetical protein
MSTVAKSAARRVVHAVTTTTDSEMPWTYIYPFLSRLGNAGDGLSDYGVSGSVARGRVSTDPPTPHLPNTVALFKVPLPQQDIVGDW